MEDSESSSSSDWGDEPPFTRAQLALRERQRAMVVAAGILYGAGLPRKLIARILLWAGN